MTNLHLNNGLSISAVLPAYNEEANIETSIRHLTDVLRGLVNDFEVIVTNDGSRDNTATILARLQATAPVIPLRVITHERNSGYGAALASGFNASRKDLIFFTDGDKQFEVSDLAGLIPEMDDRTDMVIGWRSKRADPPVRLLNAWCWKILVNGLFGYTAKDVDCAFKLFRRQIWERVTVDARGATFSAEFLIKARRLDVGIKERPVRHYPRSAGSPTGAKPSVIIRAFIELFRLWWSLRRERAAVNTAALTKPHLDAR